MSSPDCVNLEALRSALETKPAPIPTTFRFVAPATIKSFVIYKSYDEDGSGTDANMDSETSSINSNVGDHPDDNNMACKDTAGKETSVEVAETPTGATGDENVDSNGQGRHDSEQSVHGVESVHDAGKENDTDDYPIELLDHPGVDQNDWIVDGYGTWREFAPESDEDAIAEWDKEDMGVRNLNKTELIITSR
ncbi:hypothetical protein K432DRAFT_403575 [Lepidopterella palustris CBS 459.81]|uniref:Uncharacterized protein n=1 Tax=Lepidopterella palustris CBS 459.81 TaxID=1314670 RepID=A0A8E2EDB8_9PEZI|nr:hypothetical protein K432DRAFT_403575 [Lepidopterella palustris CBS 459.81]